MQLGRILSVLYDIWLLIKELMSFNLFNCEKCYKFLMRFIITWPGRAVYIFSKSI